jgi:tRNA pseudouridine55 synthase
MKKFEIIYKQIGETPLEALERFRAAQIAAGLAEFADVPMTYAGRLDPMAEGELLILIGDECKNKERWLGLDKEYEVEIVFGIETDTYDALGLALLDQKNVPKPLVLETHVGRFIQEYPPYSSRTVHGRQLHELARTGGLPVEMPTKEVEIYSIELLKQEMITPVDLKTRIFSMIDKVTGDFRQAEIKACWDKVMITGQPFPTRTIRVKCSSGTYMRSLAHRIGKGAHTSAFALSIKRTKLFTPQG